MKAKHNSNRRIVENRTFTHTRTHTVWAYRSTKKKKKKTSGDIFFSSKNRQGVRSTKRASVRFFFLFLSLSCSKDGGKGNDDGRSTRPVRRTTAQYKKNFVDGVVFFFFFGAEEQPLELPVQSKLRLEVTQKERLVRHFPNYHQKKFFFSPLFKGTSLQLPKQRPKQRPFQKEQKKKKRKLLFPAHNSLSQSGFRSAVFFPCFISLLSNCSLTFAADIS